MSSHSQSSVSPSPDQSPKEAPTDGQHAPTFNDTLLHYLHADMDDILSEPDDMEVERLDEASDDGMDLDGADTQPEPRGTPEDEQRKASRDSGYWSEAVRTPSGPKEYLSDTDSDVDMSDVSGIDHIDLIRSTFEKFPTETIQQVAINLTTDADLKNLMLTSSTFYEILSPAEAAVWKARFIARYDYPFAFSAEQLHTAYCLRRFVLRSWQSLADGHHKRAKAQLGVLRDMVLETYNKSKGYLPIPNISRNLRAFDSPTTSPWMVTFLTSSLFSSFLPPHGKPHPLFDTLQVLLSHLVLSPQSPMGVQVNSSRENYDIVKCYAYNQPFSTLYQSLPDEEPPPSPLRQFPNLSPPRAAPNFHLDMHTLLHIRNFWHRHIMEDSSPLVCFTSTPSAENTYATMVRNLLRLGYPTASQWMKPLQTPASPLAKKWYGHYSCIHPWPKSRADLEERQSCAEGWDHIDALSLDLTTSVRNDEPCFWPPVFASIPALACTIPVGPGVQYIRGIAPFIDLLPNAASSPATSATTPKYHPYTSLRVRGVLHALPSQSDIPGFQRLVIILYKPSTIYLCRVLEHALEEYGGSYGTAITAQLGQTVSVSLGGNDPFNISTVALTAAMALAPAGVTWNLGGTVVGGQQQGPQTQPQPQPALHHAQGVQAPSQQHIDMAYEIHLHAYLASRLSSAPLNDPSTHPFTKHTISAMEDAYQDGKHLAWEDIEYAYAYEGVVIPGGKIMMGRWWRCGLYGMEKGSPGAEVGADGEGVIVQDEGEGSEEEGEENREEDVEGMQGEQGEHDSGGLASGGADATIDGAGEGIRSGRSERTQRALERGPFVFWC